MDDGQKVEEVKLYDLKTNDEMHQMMVDKGFKKKGAEVVKEERRIKQVEKELKQQDAAKPLMSVIFQLYGAIGIVTLVLAFLINSRRGKNTRKKSSVTRGGSASLSQV